ncbi:MAG: cobalt transporter substrate-binding protein [Verrucomicrobiaceae bacterium]|nr:cobalt transporter substrate-binding protein [Verrucomicrobiaceae bacterium]
MKNHRFLFRPGIKTALIAFTICLAGLRGLAHEVWIEDAPDGRLYVRFGEYGDELEKSPGSLDALMLPFAWTPGAENNEDELKADASRASKEARAIREGKVESFEVRKQAEGFLLAGASPAKAAQAETGFTVIGKAGNPEKPARKPFFYARWQPPGAGAAKPALNFDLVPTGKTGEVCVYFRGKPLAGVKVKLCPPAAVSQELVSNAEGLVKFTAEKPGLYLLVAAHQRETVSGFFGGKPYDSVSHNCSLSWRQP